MILYPSVEISNGAAVKLASVAPEHKRDLEMTALAAARQWTDAGASFLHVIDLDGVEMGHPVNLEHVRAIVSELDVPVQYGGGIRTIEAFNEVLDAGVERVILGTAAFNDLDLLDEVVAKYASRIVVAVDGRGGMLAASGWKEITELPVAQALSRLSDRGVDSFVYTSVARSDTLAGPDLEEVGDVARAVRGRFLYAGGVGTLDDLQDLAALRQVNLGGIIVGRALYENKFSVADAKAALSAA